MGEFIKDFVRQPDGTWVCVEPAETYLESGRIQVAPGARFKPGTRFMGVDLAGLLEAQYRATSPR
ncbi:MAG TPA: hypothetical protein VF211_04185 [Burkholderiales bacterium]